jgi:hypothetical protein
MIEYIQTPVTIEKFELHKHIKSELMLAINKATADHLFVHNNTDITRCDWQSNGKADREWVQILIPKLMPWLNAWSKQFGYEYCSINELWFQQYETSSFHGWHIHGSNWTAVYYLDMPNNAPKTKWINPKDKNINEFNVSEGDILIFPSYIIHRAPMNTSSDTKTIISWNMNTELTYNSSY